MEDFFSFLVVSSVALCPWDSLSITWGVGAVVLEPCPSPSSLLFFAVLPGCWQWEEAGPERRAEVCPLLFHSWETPPVEL
jgi:hypothetical protein